MFKVTAYKDGQAVKVSTIEDPNEIKTLNMITAMADTAKALNDAGIEFDDLVCVTVRIRANIAGLNAMYYGINDPDAAAMESHFESIV